MRTRSITDEEIALIKAMIGRGMATKDIQFFFNRPSRPVNSGRISGIRDGTYSNSSEINAARKEELDTFLENFKPESITASINTSSSLPTAATTNPVSDATIKEMFIQRGEGWQFRHKESERHECKEGFGFRHADKWLRAVAALANNGGGYVIFGVQERCDENSAERWFDVVGLENSDFESADPVEFTKKLKATFDPTPVVEAVVAEIGGRKVGVLYVQQHTSRPVIAVRNEGALIKEGDIYFRYPGQSSRIKYSDLRTIFDERDRQARSDIIPMIQKIINLGPENAMIADLTNGTIADGIRSFTIDEDLLSKIKFIREGEFKEKEGAPALRLIGDVQPLNSEGHPIRKGFVTPIDLVNDFIQQKSPYEPKEYIRCAIEGGNGSWLPMHYYARKAKLDKQGLIAYIRATQAPKGRKELYVSRASRKISAFAKASGQPAQLLEELVEGKIPEITDIKIAANFGRAVAGLKCIPSAGLSEMLIALKVCADVIQSSQKPSWLSPIRRGIARLDELYFGEGDWAVK